MTKKTVRIRGTLIGEGLPKICVPLVAKDPSSLADALAKARTAQPDLVEFRADCYGDWSESALGGALLQIRDALGELPLIFTIRTEAEGGAFTDDAANYRRLLEFAAMEKLADLIDVQMRTPGEDVRELTRSLQEYGAGVIGSWHDFEKTPPVPEMVRILCDMQKCGMDITKLAVMPRSRADVMRLMYAAVQMEEEYADRPCVTMAMGPEGQISRVMGRFTGSAVTFAAAGTASAPGQMDVNSVRTLMDQLSVCLGSGN